MSDTMRFDRGCSHCVRGINHDYPQHQESIDRTARLIKLWDPQQPACPPYPPSREQVERRLDYLRALRGNLVRVIQKASAMPAISAESHEWLHAQLKVIDSEIVLREMEMETRQ